MRKGINMPQSKPLYQILSGLIGSRENCLKRGNTEWFDTFSDRIDKIQNLLPSGSGFDTGSKIDLDKSTPDKIVINTAFHHMDENGYYDHWSDHVVRVLPSLQFGFILKISNPDREDSYFLDYVHECFNYILGEEREY